MSERRRRPDHRHARAKAAVRQRRRRQRDACGERMLRPVVHYFGFIEACLASRLLTEEEALDHKKVDAAAAAVLIEWQKRWRHA